MFQACGFDSRLRLLIFLPTLLEVKMFCYLFLQIALQSQNIAKCLVQIFTGNNNKIIFTVHNVYIQIKYYRLVMSFRPSFRTSISKNGSLGHGNSVNLVFPQKLNLHLFTLITYSVFPVLTGSIPAFTFPFFCYQIHFWRLTRKTAWFTQAP